MPMCMRCGLLIKAIDNYIAKADKDLSDALKKAGFAEPEATVERIEGLEEEIADTLTAETDYFLDAIKGNVDLEAFYEDDWPKVKAKNPSGKALMQTFQTEFESYMKPLVSQYLSQTDAKLKVTQLSKQTVAWVESWSEELSRLMKLESETQIEKILTTAIAEGSSVAEVTQALIDSGIRDEYYRARRASVTEMLRVHSVAQQEAMMQSPSVSEKAWGHSGEYRNEPRENHVAMNGVRVPKNETFTLEGADGGTYHPMYPRDPVLPPGESINCHCFVQPIVSEDVLGLPLEERQRLQAEAIAEMSIHGRRNLTPRIEPLPA